MIVVVVSPFILSKMFKSSKSLEHRRGLYETICERYPNRVPVIVERQARSSLPLIEKEKFVHFSQFFFCIVFPSPREKREKNTPPPNQRMNFISVYLLFCLRTITLQIFGSHTMRQSPILWSNFAATLSFLQAKIFLSLQKIQVVVKS